MPGQDGEDAGDVTFGDLARAKGGKGGKGGLATNTNNTVATSPDFAQALPASPSAVRNGAPGVISTGNGNGPKGTSVGPVPWSCPTGGHGAGTTSVTGQIGGDAGDYGTNAGATGGTADSPDGQDGVDDADLSYLDVQGIAPTIGPGTAGGGGYSHFNASLPSGKGGYCGRGCGGSGGGCASASQPSKPGSNGGSAFAAIVEFYSTP